MNVVVDACSVINLSNAGALELVCRLRRCRLWLCSEVAGECSGDCADLLLSLVASSAVLCVNDVELPAQRVLDLLESHGLGAGETEAIAACEKLGYMLCSDDRPARALGASLLGTSRVVGSARLLQWCVEEQLVQCGRAFAFFGTMKTRGGFLPRIERAFFCAETRGC